jgi:hypothetical protein
LSMGVIIIVFAPLPLHRKIILDFLIQDADYLPCRLASGELIRSVQILSQTRMGA